jgi:hypothetical protein
VTGGVRLLTLTGAGGSGKTRLALQAAAELAEQFLDGTFFVALAPLRDTNAVLSAVAESVGLQPDDDVADWLAARRVLLVLDNLEHLQGVATVVSNLLVGDVVVLATSRAPLHLGAEREMPVEPLPDKAAAELFVGRAAAAGRNIAVDETVTASADAWTTSRSQSNSQRRGRSCSRPPLFCNASTRRSHCLRAALSICRSDNGRCAQRSNGATTSSTPRLGLRSAASRSSAARSRSTPRRQSSEQISTGSRRSSITAC